MNPLSFY